MIKLTIAELLLSLQDTLIYTFQFTRVDSNTLITDIKIDSRQITVGNVFVAIVGATYDGHDYLAEVLQNGATIAIVEKLNPSCSIPQILVKSTILSMGEVTKYIANKWTEPKVCITGSNGKTTTKFVLAAILRQVGEILCPQASFNNNIGVPLAVFSADKNQWAGIFEIGTNHPGEIAYLTNLFTADVAILTTVSATHIGNFADVDAIAYEKLDIFNNLKPTGTAIYDYNFDYKTLLLEKFADNPKLNNIKHKTFGFDPNADVWADEIIVAADKTSFRLNYTTVDNEKIVEYIELSLLGKHQVLNALAAVAAALSLGVSRTDIVTGLALAKSVNKRMQAIKMDNYKTLIDDSYNASPASVAAALKYLAGCEGKKIFILGDLGELGEQAQLEHTKIGELAKDLNIDLLVAFGDFSKYTLDAFYQAKLGQSSTKSIKYQERFMNIFADKQDLSDTLVRWMKEECAEGCYATILVKGSNFMKMWEVTDKVIGLYNNPILIH